MDTTELRQMTHGELLSLHAMVGEELRRRELTRTSNNPVADLAERVAANALGLRREEAEMVGYDAVDAEGQRYQIKARRRTPKGSTTLIGTLRGIEKEVFDYLVVMLFDEDYSILRAVKLPFSAVQREAKYRGYVNGHVLSLNKAWNAPEAVDITEECRRAWEAERAERPDGLTSARG